MTDKTNDPQRTLERAMSEERIDAVRLEGGVFVDAVRVTRVPMLVTDPTLPGNPVVFANSAFLDFAGYSMQEVLGRDPHFMDGLRTNPALIERFEAALKEGRDETLDLLQYRKDGRTRHASVFVSPLRDEAGKVTHHFLSFLDVTARVIAEEDLRSLSATLERRVEERTAELETANSRLTELLAERKLLLDEVNHRAKNSLMIASSLLAVQARRQTDSTVQAALEEAQSRLQAMAKVHDLLSLSGNPQQVDLGDYLRGVCSSLVPSEEGSRVRIVLDVEEHVPVSAEVAVSLGLIVNELVTNALKHAFPPPRSGTINVQAHRSGSDRVILVVRDNGVGMGADSKGNLGLGIVRALTRQIGGAVGVSGEGGVTTTISLNV
jgi:PAS domain S-box-containing protein